MGVTDLCTWNIVVIYSEIWSDVKIVKFYPTPYLGYFWGCSVKRYVYHGIVSANLTFGSGYPLRPYLFTFFEEKYRKK